MTWTISGRSARSSRGAPSPGTYLGARLAPAALDRQRPALEHPERRLGGDRTADVLQQSGVVERVGRRAWTLIPDPRAPVEPDQPETPAVGDEQRHQLIEPSCL